MKKNYIARIRFRSFTYLSTLFLLLNVMFLHNINAQSYRFLGSSDSGDQLVSYDVDSGTTTVIGDFGVPNIEAMVYNPDYSVLYAVDADQLGEINTSIGAFIILSNLIASNLQEIDVIKDFVKKPFNGMPKLNRLPNKITL